MNKGKKRQANSLKYKEQLGGCQRDGEWEDG